MERCVVFIYSCYKPHLFCFMIFIETICLNVTDLNSERVTMFQTSSAWHYTNITVGLQHIYISLWNEHTLYIFKIFHAQLLLFMVKARHIVGQAFIMYFSQSFASIYSISKLSLLQLFRTLPTSVVSNVYPRT